ncbi:putative nucleoside diphosphate kinase-like 5 [Apostichopus japonicus]|uniref:Nucleoside diphosphate kinase homolog 5 n=1 Tax=Stichopus japonicus TaxID=307972 RepID=A0A2G8LNR4_STIJA|nr:putative nucleoside diphosphate kinase-like 5 [Apostichopus japonicus]
MTEEEINVNMMQPPQIYVERTLAMVKPDAIHKAENIEEIILRSGFTILSKRRIHLTPEQASDFYAEHYGKMFFPSLVAYMSSGPIIVMVLAKENAIPYWRELCGPTNSMKARETHPDSLLCHVQYQALYGVDDQRNAVHGSDGIVNAEREIRFMFNDSIVEPIPVKQAAKDYLERAVNITLLAGLTELCKKKPEDPVKWLADWLIANNPNKPTINDNYKVEES